MRHTKHLLAAVLCVTAVASAASAHAANDAMIKLLTVLRDNGTISQDAFEQIVNASEADEQKATAERQEEVKTEVKQATGDVPKIETKGRLRIGSADGDFQWQPIGRLMVDYNALNSDKTKLQSGAEIRRARLGMEGLMWRHWIWKLEYDFAGSEPEMKDGYLGYKDGSHWVKAGHQFVPFGLATMSSSKYMTFIERPLMADNVLQPSRRLGISAFIHGGNLWTAHAGVFSGPFGDDPDSCSGGRECDQQWSLAARGTLNPWMRDKTHLLHAGAAVWYMRPQGETLTVAQRPGVFHFVDSKFQSAAFGQNAEHVLAYNVEGAGIWGPFAVKGEYTGWNLSRRTASDVNLQGYYVEASYFLTGESLNYEAAKGVFGSLSPRSAAGQGGIGAWQVAVRYDTLDLNDPGAGVVGGRQEALALGLNWYVNKNMRFMADYVNVLSLDRPGSIYNNDEPSAFLVRSQVYW